MDIFGVYILIFFILFLVIPIVFFILRVILWLILDYCGLGGDSYRQRRQQRRYTRHNQRDRQGNGYPAADETGRDNRYNDIFFIEPNSAEAARIRAQLEKDDKDLPTYEEVMRMTNLATPTAAPASNNNDNFVPAMPSALTMGASSSSVNTTDTTLTIPPYRDADGNVRSLTPPPYTPEPIGASVVLPITTPLHSQPQQPQPQTSQSS